MVVVAERLQEGRVQAVEEVVASWSLTDEPAQIPESTMLLVAAARKLILEALDYWHWLSGQLEADTFRLGEHVLQEIGESLQSLFDRTLAVGEKTLAIAKGVVPATEIEGASLLHRETTQLRDLRDRILANWPWDDVADLPFDRELLQQARACIGRGEVGESLAVVIDRLQAGSPGKE